MSLSTTLFFKFDTKYSKIFTFIESIFAPNPSTQRGQAVRLSSFKGQLLYTNSRSVYMRDLKTPQVCQEYTEHTSQATVAVASPSGYYIASGGKTFYWITVIKVKKD
jgi:hypothetical protein